MMKLNNLIRPQRTDTVVEPMVSQQEQQQSHTTNNSTQSPPINSQCTPIHFYSVEAVPVPIHNNSESTESSRVPEPIVRQTVYDATLIIPWWKQKKIVLCLGFLIFMAGAVVVGVLFGRPPPAPTNNGGETYVSSTDPTQTSVPTSSPTPLPPPPLIDGISNVTHLRDFVESDCVDRCWPFIEISGSTAVVVPLLINPHSGKPLDSANWSQQIHIFNKTVGGNFEAIQILDVDYQPGFTAIYDDVMVVGSNWEMLETGAVYAYERNSSGLWNLVQRIVPDDVSTYTNFLCCYLKMLDDINFTHRFPYRVEKMQCLVSRVSGSISSSLHSFSLTAQ